MSTLLTYTLSTTPSTLEAGQQNVILTLMGTNATADVVTLKGVSINVPIGDKTSATVLADAPIAIKQTFPETQWTTNTPNPAADSITFIFIPTDESGCSIPVGGSLVLGLENIQVDATPGTVTLTVTEGSSGNPTQPIALSKFPAGWGSVTFSAEPPNFNASAPVTLTWSGPDGATYAIQYVDDGSIVNIPALGESALGYNGTYPPQDQPSLIITQTTVFTLNVSETIDSNNYAASLQQTVTVLPTAPQIISFTGEIDYTQTPPILHLTWQTSGADHVAGSWTSDTQNPTATALIQPPFAPNYTITAIGGSGAASQPQTITLTWAAPNATIPVGTYPMEIATSPDNHHAFVTNNESNSVSVMDLSNFLVTHTIPVGNRPNGIAISPDGNSLFVVNNADNTVSVIDLNNFLLTHTIPVDNRPVGIAVSPDGSSLFVANYDSFTVSVIDANNFSVTHTIKVAPPVKIVVSPNGSYVFATNQNSITVSVIDVSSFSMIHSINNVGNVPSGIAILPDGSAVYVANYADDTVSVIDVGSFSVIQPAIAVGHSPSEIAVSLNGSAVLVTNFADNTVSVIDVNSSSVTQVIPVGKGPSGIAVLPDGSAAFVANAAEGTVSVLRLQVQS